MRMLNTSDMKPAATAGIILAAGMSVRFESTKQLAGFNSKPLVLHAAENALNSRLHRVVLVLGHESDKVMDAVRPLLNHERFEVIVNSGFRGGMGESLSMGVRHVMNQYPSVMVLLGDMPLIDAGIINYLLNRFENAGCDICVPAHQGRNGHPVIFNASCYPELIKLTGDTGGREIIRSRSGGVLFVDMENASVLTDIDTPRDLADITASTLHHKP